MKSRNLRISTDLPGGSWKRYYGDFEGQHKLHTGEKSHVASKHSRETLGVKKAEGCLSCCFERPSGTGYGI